MSGDNYPAGVTDADFDDPLETECEECGGWGRIEINEDFEPYYEECSECNGTGKIQHEEDL